MPSNNLTLLVEHIRELERKVEYLMRKEVAAGGGSWPGFSDAEGDPANVTSAAADGTSSYPSRRDHAHTIAAGTVTAAMLQDGAALSEILDDDGAGSGLDADKLDGQEGTYYLPASSYTAADVLTKLLTVDGAGSGLDADTLDSLSSLAFLKVDGSNYMTGALGVGAAPTSPYHLHITGATPRARIESSGTAQDMELRFYETTTLIGRLLYAGSNSSPNKYFGFVNAGAEDLRFLSDTTKFWSLSAQHTVADSSGNWGYGVSSPQGRLHAHDGTAGSLFGSKTSIGTTAVTIIPNGTGDVTKILSAEIVCSNGSSHSRAAGSLAVSGTLAITCGSDTYTLRVNADGSVDIRRTAGSNAGTAAYRLLWL